MLAAVLVGFVCTANICTSAADETIKLSSSAANGTLRAAGKTPTEVSLTSGQLNSYAKKHGIDADSLASTAPKMDQVSRWSQFNSILEDLRANVTDPEGLGAVIKIGCGGIEQPPKDVKQLQLERRPEYTHLPPTSNNTYSPPATVCTQWW